MRRWLLSLGLLLGLVVACTRASASPTAPPTSVGGRAPTNSAAQPATAPSPQPTAPANPELILATTTSTQDSGLLDTLVPLFEQQTGYKVKVIAVGTGQALTMGERGEADVLLVHAPDSEKQFIAAGHGAERQLVMHNDFIVVGPPEDPAGIRNERSAAAALSRLAQKASPFVSRGDNSGTHQLEQKLWTAASIQPKGDWYLESGQGMGATLNIASDKGAYTISDRGTYLAQKKNLRLDILVQGDRGLLNVYSVITVNPNKSSKLNYPGAQTFARFLLEPATQQVIARFGRDKYGEPLFFPDAGKDEKEL